MGQRGYRLDIAGLRAVAIGLVLVYHAGVVEGFPGGSGGVPYLADQLVPAVNEAVG